jgi:carbon-monoxide dehydrogenase large subunit
MYLPHRPAIAIGRAMHVGYPVAVVVADTLDLARDAAERVEVDYAPRPAVVNAEEASKPGAPQLYDGCPNNEAYFYQAGNKAAVDEAFGRAAHVVEQRLVINRVTANTLEPRGVTGEYDAGTGRYTLQCGFQRPWLFRNAIAETTMKIPEAELRLITGDIGGSYGLRGSVYPEIILMLWAARRVGRPVKWTCTRNEAHISDDDARDNIVDAALALDKDGKFLALRMTGFGNVGAYLSNVAPQPPSMNLVRNACGVYRIPLFEVSTKVCFTNTSPVSAYRGAGRPEANMYIERLIDEAAREMKLDRFELRRRNHVTPAEIPYKNRADMTVDSGDFGAVFEKAIKAAEGFEERKKQSKARGKLRGLGVGSYMEVTAPPNKEMGGIEFDGGGTGDPHITFITGTLDYGQGHASPMAQVLSSRLGVPFEIISLKQNDSDRLVFGAGTGGSRTAMMSGAAAVQAAELVIKKGKTLAAEKLEAAEADIEFRDGQFVVAGTDRKVALLDLAVDKKLDVTHVTEVIPSAFPNGCHVCEVEIDPETGEVEVVRYHSINDFGTVLNPLMVEGQIHGGVVQGMGQCFMESVRYDQDAQLQTGSFMDYAIPHFTDFPAAVSWQSHPVPSTTNPLGAKGCGEAGCAGAMTSVMNAVVDALRPLGIHHFDMPASPQRVWEAIRKAKVAR